MASADWSPRPLREQFGDIDIYLFDQLLRGRITPGMRIFEVGCGGGRNLVYFLQAGFDVSAVDTDVAAVTAVRDLALRLAPRLPPGNFRAEPVEQTSFADGCADLVISSAVLHFARDHQHFAQMLRGTWRLVAPGGLMFCRLASSIGIEQRVQPLGDGRFGLPDGSERYLVDETSLTEWTARLEGARLDPIKTTLVQDQRAMTTWVLRRVGG